ncbi:CCND2-like protein [Mya arenaria]|uniref:CCND2-like protein n=1 Tax=Mya arenaria TaxID=6604 RepID=A0ABY7EEL5_MYAAR|nr:G1/S-specific cyclin-D2-like [Mya arenaria]XP_052811137.1 G1/S-specific cyclin-D2-like [Mya arenaria]WAR07174.1 CCND2-like protein [Mya arenaria]WAR07242.1 CCND2-like protein [Mya arenaria]
MDLMCIETDAPRRAYEDPVLIQDSRVLQNLLALEDRYQPNPNYFKCVQTDIKRYMRKMVAQWMLEVCDEQRCEEEVFPLSMNYLDRFLSVCDTSRTRLQLLGAACMFIASKLKETCPIAAEKLVIYTDHSISFSMLMDMESLLLSKLKWDLSAVTPHDFLEQILSRLSLDRHDMDVIKKHAQTFVALCATDCKFMMYPPSMIAAGSVGAAIHGLSNVQHLDLKLLQKLHEITGIELDCLRGCQEQIEQTLAVNLSTMAPSSSGLEETSASKLDHTSSLTHTPQHEHLKEQPTTPTDVQDIHFD